MWLQELFFSPPCAELPLCQKITECPSLCLAPQQRISTYSLRAFHIFIFESGCFNGRRNEIHCYDQVPNGNRGVEESLEHKEAKKPQRTLPLLQHLQRLGENVIFSF